MLSLAARTRPKGRYAMAIYVSNTRRKALAGKDGNPDDLRGALPGRVRRVDPNPMKRATTANPLHWPRVECDLSISGLGAFRSYRAYPGKSFGGSATKMTDYARGKDLSTVDSRSSHSTPVTVLDAQGRVLRVEEQRPKKKPVQTSL